MRRRHGIQGPGRICLWLLPFLLLPGCALQQQVLHMERVPLGERMEALVGGWGNSTVLFHGEDALVVDAKMGDFARKLRREVVVDHQHHVRRMVITHWHPDHSFGLTLFTDTEVVMAHPRTRERLQRFGSKARFVDIEREAQLVLGGEEVRVIHPGVAHTDGDLVVYFPNRRLIAVGDLLSVDTLPFADKSSGGNILEYSRALERLLQLDFDRVVPGHGEVVPRQKLEVLRDYLRALKRESAQALARGLSPEAAEKEVKVPGFEALRDFILGASREINTRDMLRALADERN
jgi:cyclase